MEKEVNFAKRSHVRGQIGALFETSNVSVLFESNFEDIIKL